jgi:hypothetical protein
MLAQRRMNTAQLPSDNDVQKFIDSTPQMFANRQIWDLDQIGYTTPKDPGILKEIQDAHSLDALIGVLQAHKIAFTRQKNRLDTAVVPPDTYSKINALPPNEPFIVSIGDKSIASVVLAKDPRPITGDAAKPVAVAQMRKSQTTNTVEALLKSLRSSAKIEYQPGYAPKKS